MSKLPNKKEIDPSNKISAEKWEQFVECWQDEFMLRTNSMAKEMFYDFCNDDEVWEGLDKPEVDEYYKYGSWYFQYVIPYKIKKEEDEH
jgi:hypothetical protein